MMTATEAKFQSAGGWSYRVWLPAVAVIASMFSADVATANIVFFCDPTGCYDFNGTQFVQVASPLPSSGANVLITETPTGFSTPDITVTPNSLIEIANTSASGLILSSGPGLPDGVTGLNFPVGGVPLNPNSFFEVFVELSVPGTYEYFDAGNSNAGEIDVAAATPLPATFPLFAGGLGMIGLLGSRMRRKAQVCDLAMSGISA
jgi:hypothetical protein